MYKEAFPSVGKKVFATLSSSTYAKFGAAQPARMKQEAVRNTALNVRFINLVISPP